MKTLVLDRVSSPITSPIRPLAVAATDDGRGRRSWLLGIRLRESPAVLRAGGLCRCEAAAIAMGRVWRRGGRWCLVEGAGALAAGEGPGRAQPLLADRVAHPRAGGRGDGIRAAGA
jgi:hypothetical protein